MDNKKVILNILEEKEDFVSGSELAELIGVTRTAVWKAVKSLRNDGYEILSVTNKGYRLGKDCDVLNEENIKKGMGAIADKFTFELLSSCSSTNTYLKSKAEGLPQWHTVISETQTSGRGRLGRSFFSPEKNGLYLSVLLRPKLFADDATLITTAAAVAVCRALAELTGERAEIKWVNDVFMHGKKVCGILTEASFDMETGMVDYAVLGIGINVIKSEKIPKELIDIVGAAFNKREYNLRNKLAAAVLRNFYDIYSDFPLKSFVKEYRELNFLIGREVSVLRGEKSELALVTGIDDNCKLRVKYRDGKEETLSSGEVSVKLN